MPIYSYVCKVCGEQIDQLSSIEDRDKPRTHCNCNMTRLINVPKLCLMKHTGRDMALNALNSKETSHMKPHLKKMAAQGA